MAAQIHVGDIGTRFTATIVDENDAAVDVSAATTLAMFFKKPDGTTVTKTPAPVTTGADGRVRYTSLANDLDQAGKWQVQGKAVLPDGTWHTEVHAFMVAANLD
jgi:hypothetical protein